MNAKTYLLEDQLPLFMRVLENYMRSGYSLKQVFEQSSEEFEEPLASQVRSVAEDLSNGVSFDQALDNWVEGTPSRDLDLVLATIRLQMEVGGNLADKFKFLKQIMERRRLA